MSCLHILQWMRPYSTPIIALDWVQCMIVSSAANAHEITLNPSNVVREKDH